VKVFCFSDESQPTMRSQIRGTVSFLSLGKLKDLLFQGENAESINLKKLVFISQNGPGTFLLGHLGMKFFEGALFKGKIDKKASVVVHGQ
jgi:hypothetical protein